MIKHDKTRSPESPRMERTEKSILIGIVVRWGHHGTSLCFQDLSLFGAPGVIQSFTLPKVLQLS